MFQNYTFKEQDKVPNVVLSTKKPREEMIFMDLVFGGNGSTNVKKWTKHTVLQACRFPQKTNHFKAKNGQILHFWKENWALVSFCLLLYH